MSQKPLKSISKVIYRVLYPLHIVVYNIFVKLLTPINNLLALKLKNVKHNNSVLHISYMIHIPYYTVKILRRLGVKADYLAIGTNPTIWNKSDFIFKPSRLPAIRVWQEIFIFWTIVAKYEIIHAHFATTLSLSGWELPYLKKMGRKVVIHYRGCEIRDREKNMTLHPQMNICQVCDYNASICKSPVNQKRRELAQKYGDLFLVTTPDLKDFVPEAIHFPFFAPDIDEQLLADDKNDENKKIKIVHVTAHPGIEGTEKIQTVVENLKKKGYPLEFVFLHLVPHEQVLKEMATASLTIGKMKMGYYANAQIESMFLGIPAVTFVRPEFMNDELKNSGFIFTTLQNLEETLEYYLAHPNLLEQKRKIARSSILQLHDNEKLGNYLVDLYARTKEIDIPRIE